MAAQSPSFSGGEVKITCYQPGCEEVSIPVTLGEKMGALAGLGLSAGRLSWPASSLYQAFELGERHRDSGRWCSCPNCKTQFDHVVFIFPPNGEAIVYGYDPDPA